MTSREQILRNIKSGRPSAVAHPQIPTYTIAGNPLENFKSKLKQADGCAIEFDRREDAIAWLIENVLSDEKIVFSSVSDVSGNVMEADFADPHNANITDICVTESEIGVGETGSIWLTNDTLKVAAAALFATDLYILLPKDKIVSSLDDAYHMLRLGESQYGAFYTGPSATADIEAVHVTGAQGEISLTALLY